MKKFTLSVASVMAISTFAIAGGDIAPVEEPIVEVAVVDDSSFYVGLGYSYMEYESSWVDGGDSAETADGNAITVLAGYNFNKYIAVEGRYSITLGDITYNDNDIESEISNIGLYVKPMLPIDNVTLYGLLGYGKVTVDFNDNGADKVSESGFQWRLGASVAVTDNIELFIDYTKLYDGTGMEGDLSNYEDLDFDIDSINVGVTYKF